MREEWQFTGHRKRRKSRLIDGLEWRGEVPVITRLHLSILRYL